MPGKIINTTQSTVADSRLDLSHKRETLRKLDDREAAHHFSLLAMALVLLEKMIKERLEPPESRDVHLAAYLGKLARTVRLLAVKDKLCTLTDGDLKNPCAIHPTDSGFPLFIRDLESLRRDKQEAVSRLAALPSDEALVENALFSLFRGQFPQETITKKYSRSYWAGLQTLELPSLLALLDEQQIDLRDANAFYSKSVERFDDTNNLPLFYSLYFRVPDGFFEMEWREKLDLAVRSGMGTAISLEMPYLARQVEAVEGVALDMLERYTIGPFYTAHTNNKGPVADLIRHDADYIMMFRKCTVVRVADQPQEGLGRSVRGFFSGDSREGLFGPPLDSPQYLLMPYRMVQKAHDLDAAFGPKVRMFGVTKDGGLLD